MSGTGSSQQSKFTEALREEVVDPVNKSSLAICNVKISCHFSNETDDKMKKKYILIV